MCVIIYGPKEVEESTFRSAYSFNPDGIGMMWSEKKTLHIWKGMEFNSFYKFYKKLISRNVYPAIHFRLATVGSVSFENLHPFKLGSGIGMMHNGTFNIPNVPKGHSDTRFFAENLAEFEWNQLKTMDNPIYSAAVNNSRVLFMNHLGEVIIVNKNSPITVEKEGVWYSKNNIFRDIRVAVYGTLKEGYSNSHLLDSASKEGTDTIQGWDMYTNGSFPCIVKGKGSIHIESYLITQAELERLDRLEGYPHHYNRSIVATKYGPAMIYHYDRKPHQLKKVSTGFFENPTYGYDNWKDYYSDWK